MSRASANSLSSSSNIARRSSLDSMIDDQLFPLELSIIVKGLAPTSNPIVGMFGIDTVSGGLNFLAHTELQRATGHPKFEKRLHLNYYPGRNQKIHFNVYSAPWRDDGVDNDICEEDRVGSVIVSLDKIPSLQSRLNFVPIKIELPLWHDTDTKLHQALQRQGTAIMIEFHAQEGMDTGPLTGPKSEMTYLESIQMMTTGAVFLKYRFSSSGKPQKRFVFYDRADGPMGTIYWCEDGKRKKEKDKCIPLHTVTGLFEENQTKAFQKFFKKPDPKQLERCFSIVAKERTLDLEAATKAQRDAFMYGIHKVLTSQGFGIKEKEKGEDERQKFLEDRRGSARLVRNTFEITTKLRNLPIMPWANDDSNKTLVALYEKQGNTFVLIEQTDWQLDNAQPNFTKPLLMTFTIPLVPSIVKIVIYDHVFDDSHVVGSALVRTDTFQRYVGQEMLIKLKNHGDAQLDTALSENNTYMLLTAVVRQGDVREQGLGPADANARKGFNAVLGQLKGELGGGGGGGKGKGQYRSTFIKSIITFMGAGETFTLHPVYPAFDKAPALPEGIADIKQPIKVQVYYRAAPGSPVSSTIPAAKDHGHLYFISAADKTEDDFLDDHGQPLNPILILPMSQLNEALTGIHPPHFKNKGPDLKAERCMTLMVKKSENEAKIIYSLDIECRNKALRDAWSSGLGDFISYMEESVEGGDDEKLKFLEDDKNKPHTALDAAKKNKLQGDSNIMDEAHGRFGGAGTADGKLRKGQWDTGDEAEEEEDFAKKDKKAKIELEAPVLGEGDIPAPPPMFDVVFGADGVPLPPPLAPSFTVAAPAYTGPKLKRLHWEALDGINVDGTLWGLVQGDLEAEAGAMLEEMFKMADAKKKTSAEEEEAKEKLHRLYDSKRAQNIEILLKSFRMPIDAIQDAIVSMDMSILTQERLQILLTCCPTIEETQKLKDYRKKHPELENMGQAEMFGYALLEIPKVTMRLRLLLFQTKFDGIIKDMIDQYTILLDGTTALKNSEKLKQVMQVVLGVGNYLNQSTRKKAVGFRLQALEKLNDTKSTDGKQTLLDFIVDYMEKIKAKDAENGENQDPADNNSQDNGEDKTASPSPSNSAPTTTVIDGEKQPPPSYLADLAIPVHEASLIDWKALNEERENLFTGLSELDKELQSMGGAEEDSADQFKVVMAEFLEHAHKRSIKLKKKYNDVQEESDSLIEYFGENSKSMETTELFKIFDRFFNMYKGAEINAFNKKELEAKKERLAKFREEQQKAKEEKIAAAAEADKGATQIEKVKLERVLPAASSASSASSSSLTVKKEEQKDDIMSPGHAANAFGVTLKKRPSITESTTAATTAATTGNSIQEEKAAQQRVTDAIAGKTKYIPTSTATTTISSQSPTNSSKLTANTNTTSNTNTDSNAHTTNNTNTSTSSNTNITTNTTTTTNNNGAPSATNSNKASPSPSGSSTPKEFKTLADLRPVTRPNKSN